MNVGQFVAFAFAYYLKTTDAYSDCNETPSDRDDICTKIVNPDLDESSTIPVFVGCHGYQPTATPLPFTKICTVNYIGDKVNYPNSVYDNEKKSKRPPNPNGSICTSKTYGNCFTACEQGWKTLLNYKFSKKSAFSCIVKGNNYCTCVTVATLVAEGVVPSQNYAFLKRGLNMICVDWGNLSGKNGSGGAVDYIFAAKQTKTVGSRIAEFLIFLKKEKYLKSYDDVHLIGLSLGAHCSGSAGSYLEYLTNEKLKRITGLDPAGPVFDSTFLSFAGGVISTQLQKERAKYVDVIHTDYGEFGTKINRGHIDYYANGGRTIDQSYCRINNVSNTCGHTISVDYFERAFLGEKLLGCGCKYNSKATSTSDDSPCPAPNNCAAPTPLYGSVVASSDYGTYFLPVDLCPTTGTPTSRDYEPYKAQPPPNCPK